MKTVLVEKPELDRPLIYTYSVSGEDMERFRRKKQRAKELGINLFVLDEDDIPYGSGCTGGYKEKVSGIKKTVYRSLGS